MVRRSAWYTGFGKPRLLHFVVEHEAAECFGRARPARLLRFRHRPVANRADRFTEHYEPMTSPP